jgi:hypothetical protein
LKETLEIKDPATVVEEGIWIQVLQRRAYKGDIVFLMCIESWSVQVPNILTWKSNKNCGTDRHSQVFSGMNSFHNIDPALLDNSTTPNPSSLTNQFISQDESMATDVSPC